MDNPPEEVTVQRDQQEARSDSDNTNETGETSGESATTMNTQHMLNNMQRHLAEYLAQRDVAGFSSSTEATSGFSSTQSDGRPFSSAGDSSSLRGSENEMEAFRQTMDPPVQLIDPPGQTIFVHINGQGDASPLLPRRSALEGNPQSSVINNNASEEDNSSSMLAAALYVVQRLIQPEMQGLMDLALMNNVRAQETSKGLNGHADIPPPELSTGQSIMGNVQSDPRIGLPSSETTFAESQKQHIQASHASMAKEYTELADSILALKMQVEALHGDCRDLKSQVEGKRTELKQLDRLQSRADNQIDDTPQSPMPERTEIPTNEASPATPMRPSLFPDGDSEIANTVTNHRRATSRTTRSLREIESRSVASIPPKMSDESDDDDSDAVGFTSSSVLASSRSRSSRQTQRTRVSFCPIAIDATTEHINHAYDTSAPKSLNNSLTTITQGTTVPATETAQSSLRDWLDDVTDSQTIVPTENVYLRANVSDDFSEITSLFDDSDDAPLSRLHGVLVTQRELNRLQRRRRRRGFFENWSCRRASGIADQPEATIGHAF